MNDIQNSTLPKVTIVVARASNFVIGNNGDIPWYIPDDLKHFKKVTMGKPVIMGRRTYDSIGRPLPGRHNVVVSRNPDLKIQGVDVVSSIEEAIKLCDGEEEVCLIGGGQIYQEGLKFASKAIVTEICFPTVGDAYFMPLDSTEWQTTDTNPVEAGECSYRFVTYERTNTPATPE